MTHPRHFWLLIISHNVWFLSHPGMQPLMMSVMDAIEGNPCWVRVGTDVCYYKNHFIRNANTTGGVKGKSYYTATFTVTFKNSGDVCYISYHYPYSYTALKVNILSLTSLTRIVFNMFSLKKNKKDLMMSWCKKICKNVTLNVLRKARPFERKWSELFTS